MVERLDDNGNLESVAFGLGKEKMVKNQDLEHIFIFQVIENQLFKNDFVLKYSSVNVLMLLNTDFDT